MDQTTLSVVKDLVSTMGFPIVVTGWLLYRDYKWISSLVVLEQQEVDLLRQMINVWRGGSPSAEIKA